MVLQLSQSHSAPEILHTCTASTNSSARATLPRIVPAPTLVIKARKSASHSPARSVQLDVATPPAIIGDVQLELINSPAFSSVSKSSKSQREGEHGASERDRETGREGIGVPLQRTSRSTSAMSTGPSPQALEREKSAMSSDAPLAAKRVRSWKEKIFGIGPEDLDIGQPESKLISPLSPFSIAWTLATAVLLAYTAVVTPPQISFGWLDPACTPNPTLPFDCIIDVFFLLDIAVTLNSGIRISGEYIDDRRKITRLYLTGAFWFDALTSVPVSFFELAASVSCATEPSPEDDSSELKFIRAIKPLRWFKIARILKLGKFSKILDSLMDTLSLSAHFGKSVEIGAILLLTIHLLSCCWFLWKALGMTLEEINHSLDAEAWGVERERHELHTTLGKVEAYVLSVYLVSMTITTVGYGDITAENTWERIGYSLFFIVCAFSWGELIAGVTVMTHSRESKNQETAAVLQDTLGFLLENDCPFKLRVDIMKWTRENKKHSTETGKTKEMIDTLPPDLQKALVHHLYAKEVSRVPVLHFLESLQASTSADAKLIGNFLSELFIRFQYKMYAPGSVLVNFSDPPDRLLFLVSGQVDVEFEHPNNLHSRNMVLNASDYVGDMTLLGVHDWAESTCFYFPKPDPEPTEIRVTAKVHEFVVVLQLDKAHWDDALSKSPVTCAAVDEWLENWKVHRKNSSCSHLQMKVLQRWERLLRPLRRQLFQTNFADAYRWGQAIKAMKVATSQKDFRVIAETKGNSTENAVIESCAPHNPSFKTLLQLEAEAKWGPKGGVHLRNLEQRIEELEKAFFLQRLSNQEAFGRVETVLAVINDKITKSLERDTGEHPRNRMTDSECVALA